MQKHLKHVKMKEAEEITSPVLNEEAFASDSYQFIYILLAIFLGCTGLQYVYIKRYGLLAVNALAVLCLWVLSDSLIMACVIIQILAIIVSCFLYTDGKHKTLR